MSKARCLFLCTTRYNASALRRVAEALPELDCWFSPFYSSSTASYQLMNRLGIVAKTPLSPKFQQSVIQGMRSLELPLDIGARNNYDLVVLGNDFYMPQNLRHTSPKVLVQEGWLWPYHWRRRLSTMMRLPPITAGANGSGLSCDYDYFCVASASYHDALASSGVPQERLVVTGLPMLDDVCRELNPLINETSELNYVLLATHPGREYFEGERRHQLLRRARYIAAGRPIIVKLHPHEKESRARNEIERWLPEARISEEGDIRPLIANCSALVTTYSTVSFYALLIGKPVFSSYRSTDIAKLLPEQNGEASHRIAAVCRAALTDARHVRPGTRPNDGRTGPAS